jgi:dihydroorotate dehydrogenase
MGFNNDGVDQLLENVDAADFPRRGGILGINIGKNFDTPIDKAADDYLILSSRTRLCRGQLRDGQCLQPKHQESA